MSTPEIDAACVYEYVIRGETINAWCATHQMWRDVSESSFDANPKHEAAMSSRPGQQAPR